MSNYAYSSMLFNWKCFLERHNIENYLIITLEEKLHNLLESKNYHSYYPSELDTFVGDINYNAQLFKKITKIKSYFVYRALKLGYNVLLSDGDIVFLKNPLPYIYSLGE